MTGNGPRSPSLLLALAALSLGAVGCYGGNSGATYYGPGGGGGPGGGPTPCVGGIQMGSIDTGALLDLDPGHGVGTTVEYAGDGAWRFAVTCDSAVSGYGCYWRVLVSSLDGSIQSLEPEALELDDVVEFYPSTPGSTVEDGVMLDSYTESDIDAFTVLATPGAGMRIDASIGVDCGGPYLFWTDQASVQHSSTNPTDLVPTE